MTAELALAAAVLSWAGAAVVVVSDGRRGLSLGLAIATAGIGAQLVGSQPLPAGLLSAAGLGSALLRLRDGGSGWGVLPPGSTPRLILSLVVGAAAAYSGTLLGPEGEPWLVAGLVAAGTLGTAVLLGSRRRQHSLAAAALLALALGAVDAVINPGACLVVAAGAAGLMLLLGLIPAGSEDGI